MKLTPDADIDLIGDDLDAGLAGGIAAKVVGVDAKKCQRDFPNLSRTRRLLCVEGKGFQPVIGGSNPP